MATKHKRRSGDRYEGRLLHSVAPFNKFMPFIMPHRDDAQNFYDESFEVSSVDKMLRRERVEGYKGIGFLHFMIATYIRCISMLPGVNRFIAGRRIYARNNIEICMVVKRSISIDSTETTIKVQFDPSDTIYDVYRKMNQKIDEIKASDDANNTEDFAEFAAKLPRFLLKFVILILRIMDYFGIIPPALLNLSPFHGSMFITDVGSLRIGPIFHHIYNFGTIPVFISFGAKHHKYELDRHGEMVDKKYIDTKFVLDERTVDGHYYAQFLQAMRYIFAHPEIVENPPSRIIEDIN